MKNNKQDKKIAKMAFASVYPAYLAKVQKKGRTEAGLQQVITWLTGYDEKRQQEVIAEKVSFQFFFEKRHFILMRT